MLEFLKNKKILIVVAHPDDETLGLGGTISKLSCSSEIKVIILGEGLTSREIKRNVNKFKSDLEIHKSNINKAKSLLGYKELALYNLPDNRFDTIPLLDIIKIIEREKTTFDPDIVFTHHNGDLNIDHRKTFEAVYTSFRPLPSERLACIITFETLSGTEWIPSNDNRKFNPNFFVELESHHINKKTKAMECYDFEKREYPHPRSSIAIENRAKMWGNSIGTNYAEPFQIIRMIFKK